MAKERFPEIMRLRRNQQNGESCDSLIMDDKVHDSLMNKALSCQERLMTVFQKQNPSHDDTAEFKHYLNELTEDIHIDMVCLESNYAFIEGFITASRLFHDVGRV